MSYSMVPQTSLNLAKPNAREVKTQLIIRQNAVVPAMFYWYI